MKSRIFLSLLLVVVLLAFAVRTEQPTAVPASDSIRISDLRRHVMSLTSDDFNGRLSGTEGNQLAVEFVRSHFARLGLEPANGDSFLSSFDLIVPTLGPDNDNYISVIIDGTPLAPPQLGSDFYPERFSGSSVISAQELLFIGFGIFAPDLDHDDYDNVDVTGKIVVILNHEPGEFDSESPFDGAVPSEHSRPIRKAMEAKRRGAVAVLFVNDLHNHNAQVMSRARMDRTWPSDPRLTPRYELGVWVDATELPVLNISTDLASRLLRTSRANLRALAEQAETKNFKPESVELDISISAEINRERLSQDNVIAAIKGSDPQLQEEWIILGAHLDHEGANGVRIYRGADDNASGVAGLLEIAEAYALAAHEGSRPRRSVMFAAWNSEERGLLGSWSYTEQPLAPLSNTIALLNMDMIGRNEEIPSRGGSRFRGLPTQTAVSNENAVNILGYSFSLDLQRAVEIANNVDLTLRFRYDHSSSNLLRRSDQWPFLSKGVPALFVHTGLHPDYHTYRDQPEKLNYEKMARIVKMVHQLSWNLSQQNLRPKFDRH